MTESGGGGGDGDQRREGALRERARRKRPSRPARLLTVVTSFKISLIFSLRTVLFSDIWDPV